MLHHLHLENYRNHSKYDLDFDQTTVLYGKNGVGKSNILESIVLISFCRSFREDDKANLVKHGEDYARVTADNLEIFIQKHPKYLVKAKKGGVPYRLTDFVGILPTVVFTPETMMVVTGAPADRRRFLDAMISQTDKEYLQALVAYNKVRSRRNRLLYRLAEGQGDYSELDYWDKELANQAAIIVAKRQEVAAYLNTGLSQNYQKISGQKEASLEIRYLQNSPDLAAAILEKRGQEIAQRRTLFGPHKDDLKFILNGNDASNFASRGEIKSATLSLKIAELHYLEEKRGSQPLIYENTKPMLLLDDIFSEFDKHRREHISELIANYPSLITTANLDDLDPSLRRRAKVVEIL